MVSDETSHSGLVTYLYRKENPLEDFPFFYRCSFQSTSDSVTNVRQLQHESVQ